MVKLILVKKDGSLFEEKNILSFVFSKDMYVPYTELSVRFKAQSEDFNNVCEVKLVSGGKEIHHGLLDNLDFYKAKDCFMCRIESRGFTSLLCQNQIEPGLKTNISFNSLMDGYYTLPYVTHEDNSDTGNYIYVKDNSNMWDGVVNLSYKLYGNYPFIRGTNCVRITPAADRSEFLYSDNSLLRSGTRRSTKRFASHFHMADINGEYGQFELTDADVVSSKIIRHLYFDLDKQFLYSPQEALVYRDKYDKRAGLEYYCLYSGYNGEDLSDLVSFGPLQKRKISSVKIYGGSNGIFTELGVYIDDFNN